MVGIARMEQIYPGTFGIRGNMAKANQKFTGIIKGVPAHQNKHDFLPHNKACVRQTPRKEDEPKKNHGGKY